MTYFNKTSENIMAMQQYHLTPHISIGIEKVLSLKYLYDNFKPLSRPRHRGNFCASTDIYIYISIKKTMQIFSSFEEKY